MDSILTSIKIQLGITEECTDFDFSIIMNINAVLAAVFQIGVGENCLSIIDSSAVWNDLTSDPVLQGFCKSYVYLKVKMLFDPPTASTAVESNNRLISELESRIKYEAGN